MKTKTSRPHTAKRCCGDGIAAIMLAILVSLILASTAFAYETAPAQIWTVAGIGAAGSAGDGGPAIAAELNSPFDAVPTADGGILIADMNNNEIREVAPDGTITTVAGNGTAGYSGDGGPAVDAELNAPRSIVALSDGGFLIADTGNNVIREVAPDGTITTVAGNGTAGYSGDGGPAVNAELNTPTGISRTSHGEILIADFDNSVIREVASDGTITTVAGDGVAGYSGDAGPATAASLYHPGNVAALPGGGFLIADSGNNRVREVDAGGTITTVAGDGVANSVNGLGGEATNAAINDPWDVTAEPDGGFLIAEFAGQMVAQVSPSGIITDVAGNGSASGGGDGGSAVAAGLRSPVGVAVTPDGGFLIADSGNDSVRWVAGPQAGATGARGATGAKGATGARGAKGAPGRVRVITCRTITRRVRGRRRKVAKCTSRLVSGTVTFTKARTVVRARLTRRGRLYARGLSERLNGRNRLVLRDVRAVPRGTYSLILRTRRHGHWHTARRRIVIR